MTEKIDITQYGFSILQIETISRCNMECEFCGYPLRRDKDAIMPEADVLRIIDSIELSSRFQHLCLSQFNEPLLDKRIYKFINYARARKIPVMIITNGLLFNSKEVIMQLLESAPDQIKISVQVLNQKLFSSVRKTRCDFEKYRSGIAAFLTAAQGKGPEVTIDIACNFLSGTNIVKRWLGLEYGDPSVYNTINELRTDIRLFLAELGKELPSFRYDENHVDHYLTEVGANYVSESGLKITDNISLKIKPFIFGRRITQFYPLDRARPCSSKILGILSDGSIVPCCMAYDAPCIGSIKKETLGTVLKKSQPLLANIRLKGEGLPSACRHCLGAPTKRGALLKKLRYGLIRGQAAENRVPK